MRIRNVITNGLSIIITSVSHVFKGLDSSGPRSFAANSKPIDLGENDIDPGKNHVRSGGNDLDKSLNDIQKVK